MTDSANSGADAEFAAMQGVYTTLVSLEAAAQQRVLDYVVNRLGLAAQSRPHVRVEARAGTADESDHEDDSEEAAVVRGASAYGSLAELSDAAQPKSQSDKALVCGYWLQVCQGADNFDAFSVNKELKNLGEGVPNITSALDTLKAQKPALALQLKKAGKSRQARKTYKITVAGVKAVEAMIGG